MRQNVRKKKQYVFPAAVITSIMMATPAMAAWQTGTGENVGRWWFDDGNGFYRKDGWHWIDGNEDGVAECYYFDLDGWLVVNGQTPDGYQVNADGAWIENGIVKTQAVTVTEGWKQGAGANTGRWWFADGNGSYRKNGWYWIDGNKDGIAECYYFDQDGWLMMNGQTPDGYQVDADGAWVNNGVKQTRQVIPGTTGDVVTNRTTTSRGGSSSRRSNNSSDTFIILDGEYSNSASSMMNSRFLNGPSYGRLTKQKKQEIDNVVSAFKQQYISNDMSDFEKELMIIGYIVENCSYNSETDECASAYGALVKGEAKCMGYADAFMVMAKACGMETRYVTSENHAWNLLKLDGDWYHVDVTWEDPVVADEEGNGYGIGKLCNQYINLTDAEMERRHEKSHTDWSPRTIKANGTKYGPLTVQAYQETGEIHTDEDVKYREETDALLKSYDEDGKLLIHYLSTEDAVSQMISYMDNCLDEWKKMAHIAISFENLVLEDTYGYDIKAEEIEEKVNEHIKAKYGDVLEDYYEVNLYTVTIPYGTYYAYAESEIQYKPGKGKPVPYVVHFENENGELFSESQTGTAVEGQRVMLDYPDGYGSISLKECNIAAGDVIFEGGYIIIIGENPIDITVKVKRNKGSYVVHYVDRLTGEEVETLSGYITAKNANWYLPKIPEGYRCAETKFTVNQGDASLLGSGTFGIPFSIDDRVLAQDYDLTVYVIQDPLTETEEGADLESAFDSNDL